MRGRYLMLCSAAFLGCAPGTVSGAGSGGVPGGSGGAPGTGGVTATGTGGATATGGVTGTGGATGTGGVTGTGGATGAAGATPGTGGTVGTGGITGAGGSIPLTATYFIGTDISRVQTDPAGTTYTDNDGTRKDLLVLLKGHGFNYIRVRTFVDPKAADGNDKVNGFYDIPHTITFGKRIKDAGMGFLLDFHYADNWADPGKQCVPPAWQGFTTIAQLATAVHDYTKDAITRLIAGGARPDMVQIGNEITPGMLIHRCDAGGQPIAGMNNPVSGVNSAAGWPNLGLLLKGAAQGIKDVDTGIKIMLHIDRAQDFAGSRSYIMNAIAQGVPFDVFGESSYTLYQGPPAGWMSTFTQLAAAFPTLKFVSAEYGPEQRAINDILFNLPNQQGIGTFYWEATHSGADNAGHLLFSNRVAQPDLMLYDLMKTAYAGRL